MPRPVCVSCKCFYRPKKNGYIFIEGKPDKYDGSIIATEIRGNRHPEMWSPYKVWRSDLYECPDCYHRILVGFAQQPSSQDYLPGFEEECKLATIQVNDC